MNLIDKQNRARPEARSLLRLDHHLLDLFDPTHHSRELNEAGLRHLRDDLRQRSLARPRRPPEDHRSRIVALDRQPQRLARPQQMLLPHILIQRPAAASSRPAGPAVHEQIWLAAASSAMYQTDSSRHAPMALPSAARPHTAATTPQPRHSSSPPPGQGIVTRASPSPSTPRSTRFLHCRSSARTAPVKSISCAAVTPASSDPTAAINLTPRLFNPSISCRHRNHRHPKHTPHTRPQSLLVPRAHRPRRRQHARRAKRLRRPNQRPQIPRILQPRRNQNQRSRCLTDYIVHIKHRRHHQRSNALRRLRLHHTPKHILSSAAAPPLPAARSSAPPAAHSRRLSSSTIPLRSASSSRWSPSIATIPPLSRAWP